MGFFDSIRFFDRFRAPKGCWPWPNSDSPVVQSKLLTTATHEAGHAVVGCYFGIKVTQLSIRRIGGNLGRVEAGLTHPQLQATALGLSRKIFGKSNPF